MSQPEWETIYRTDCELLQVDKTGVYAPELERAEEYETKRGTMKFLVFRFSVDRLMRSPTQLSLMQLRPTMEHIPYLVDVIDDKGVEHRPWFEDQMHEGRGPGFCIAQAHSAYCPLCGRWIMLDLSEAARCAGLSSGKLRRMFTSDDPRRRARAYGVIAGYHGWENFDHYPLTLTERQFDKRWSHVSTRIPLTLEARRERLEGKK